MSSTSIAPASSRRAAWLGFAPVAAWVALRWVLAWLDERRPPPDAWALAPFVGTQDPWAWLRPAGIAIAALVLLALLARAWAHHHGTRALRRLAAGAWVLLWLAACAAQLMAWQNRHQLAPQAPLLVETMGRHAQPPSLRSLGGTLWVLRIDGQDALQQVLLPDGAAPLALHQRLRLHWARGHWYGRYVTGWDMLESSQ